jgi:serine protease SohB
MKARALISWLPVERFRNPPPLVAVVPLRGLIGGMGPLRRGLTLTAVASLLERAFKLDEAKAVALIINSPGGSAVQSSLIGGRIRALAEEHKRPVLAFVEDVAASGGYWLAASADEIFADPSSIVGSIGVISAGFGFPGLLQRLGIERRVYAAGAHKDGLDPFQPEKPDEVAHLRLLQEDVFGAFRDHVRARRGAKLRAAEESLFNGRFWSGRQALELGLIDGLGDVRGTLRGRFGEKVRLRLISDGRPWWQRRLHLPSAATGRAEPTPGAAWAEGLLAAVEERCWWSRYGL